MRFYSAAALLVLYLSVLPSAEGQRRRCSPRGCPLSRCGKLSPGQTPYSCPKGYVTDHCGCEDQDCQCAECTPFDQTMNCRYGYRTRRGCPANRCYSRLPKIKTRCPNNQEPLGEIGHSCSRKNQCRAPEICCKTHESGSRNCVAGIPVEPVEPFPPSCEGSVPYPGTTPEEHCSIENKCPVGYTCCSVKVGYFPQNLCRKLPQTSVWY